MRVYWYCTTIGCRNDLTDRLIAGQDVRYAVEQIKTGISFVDKMAIMEIIWYAAQWPLVKVKSQIQNYHHLKYF